MDTILKGGDVARPQDAAEAAGQLAVPVETGVAPVTGRAHALLSASSSERWLHCTPAAVAESKYPDAGSDFAREGTLAHAIGARKIKEQFGFPFADEEREIAELSDAYYSGEMEEHTDGYAAYVLERWQEARAHLKDGDAPVEIMIEARLDFSDYVPDGFGTGDAVIVGGNRIEVIDLKYGKGVRVSAENNPQMKLYALGALSLFDYAYDIEEVTMTIYQPRIGNLSRWSIRVDALLEWAMTELEPLAMLASRGLGVRDPGKWCRFCKAAADCPAVGRSLVDAWLRYSDAQKLAHEDMTVVLDQADVWRDWLKAVEERALTSALNGEEVPGYKVVEGRSVRKITDPERAAAALLDNGAAEESVWRPRELQTLTTLERTFGRKMIAQVCGEFITKPKGKPTLAPVDDRRPALSPGDDFAGMV